MLLHHMYTLTIYYCLYIPCHWSFCTVNTLNKLRLCYASCYIVCGHHLCEIGICYRLKKTQVLLLLFVLYFSSKRSLIDCCYNHRNSVNSMLLRMHVDGTRLVHLTQKFTPKKNIEFCCELGSAPNFTPSQSTNQRKYLSSR